MILKTGGHTRCGRPAGRAGSVLEVISSNRRGNCSRGIQMLPLSLRWVAENVEPYWRRKIQFFSGLITVIVSTSPRSNLDGKYRVWSYIKCWWCGVPNSVHGFRTERDVWGINVLICCTCGFVVMRQGEFRLAYLRISALVKIFRVVEMYKFSYDILPEAFGF